MTRKVRKIAPASDVKIERPERDKLTGAESLKRMREFTRRKEKFVASVRAGKNRGLPSRPA